MEDAECLGRRENRSGISRNAQVGEKTAQVSRRTARVVGKTAQVSRRTARVEEKIAQAIGRTTWVGLELLRLRLYQTIILSLFLSYFLR